jgi:hypothetical protein
VLVTLCQTLNPVAFKALSLFLLLTWPSVVPIVQEFLLTVTVLIVSWLRPSDVPGEMNQVVSL